MIKRGPKKVLVSISFFQIFLLISFAFSISFILSSSVSALQPQATIVGTKNSELRPGQTFMDVQINGETKRVKWLGPTSSGLQEGILANGQKVTWENIHPSEVEIVSSLNSEQITKWGETFNFNGNDYSVSEVLLKPSAVPGMVESGKLTSSGTFSTEPFV